MGYIRVQSLGKAYKQYPSRWARLSEWLFPFNSVRHRQHWVLKDVSFSVQPGDALGIIGLNGAGKSTLLKLVTGTTFPTCGSVDIQGRVSALLELGMGFHPEFTGRQNAMISGQLLGMSSRQIVELMPGIEAFAEIDGYMDEPLRVYSSGMQVRLAFALATAVRPDVLIVDEALSVGDAYFQHKCLARIREFRTAGTTLLLVSHDKQAIKSMCDTAILLHQGRIEATGSPEAVMDFYNALLADTDRQHVQQFADTDGRIVTVSGTGEAKITFIGLRNGQGELTSELCVGETAKFEVKVVVNAPISRLVLGYGIRDKYGQVIFGTNTALTGQEIRNPKLGSEIGLSVEFAANLGPGSYSLQLALVNGISHLDQNYEWRDMALVFTVKNLKYPSFEGCSWLPPKIEISA